MRPVTAGWRATRENDGCSRPFMTLVGASTGAPKEEATPTFHVYLKLRVTAGCASWLIPLCVCCSRSATVDYFPTNPNLNVSLRLTAHLITRPRWSARQSASARVYTNLNRKYGATGSCMRSFWHCVRLKLHRIDCGKVQTASTSVEKKPSAASCPVSRMKDCDTGINTTIAAGYRFIYDYFVINHKAISWRSFN